MKVTLKFVIRGGADPPLASSFQRRCSMRKAIWVTLLALPLAVVGGLVYANVQKLAVEPEQTAASYVCPITGEELPCPLCCPLNEGK
jgi:hypothetical protein